jgi:hypothetical protein
MNLESKKVQWKPKKQDLIESPVGKGDCMPRKNFKHTCACINCGNEAEMMVTCTVDETPENTTPRVVAEKEGKTKGHAVCSHCGGEADIWLDI